MNALLRVDNLSVGFQNGKTTTLAVKNISFSVNRGEILAIVGESGSGKSVSALSILQLLPSPPAKYLSGRILFSEDSVEEEDLLQKNRIDLFFSNRQAKSYFPKWPLFFHFWRTCQARYRKTQKRIDLVGLRRRASAGNAGWRQALGQCHAQEHAGVDSDQLDRAVAFRRRHSLLRGHDVQV